MHCHTVHLVTTIFLGQIFCSAAGQSKKNSTAVVLSISLASENTLTRVDYMSTGPVMFYVSGDESTQVNLSPGAKHLHLCFTHTQPKSAL